MSTRFDAPKFCLAGAIVALSLVLPTGMGSAFAAEPVSSEQIIQALKPPKLTRSLTTSPADIAHATQDARLVNSLRNRTSRSLSTEEREKIASLVQDKPSIDLEINFEFDSATIGRKATPQVAALGSALTSSDLKGRTFILAGHTDAKGTETYNQDLSERRAESVKRYLHQRYGIEPANLLTVGYGKTQLKNSTDPLAAENRRVQIVNVADK
ncbi:MAG TPA: OmpA family protein [Xanthobacteraceae bacterium]|jgi:outer membrane protein OmpA-like peptidoglycan-associated protein